jgi:predicted nucleic-acid-binding protein
MRDSVFSHQVSRPRSRMDTADLAFEDEPSVESAVYSWKDSAADFAHCLIEARNRRLGCRATAAFDAGALKLAGFISV